MPCAQRVEAFRAPRLMTSGAGRRAGSGIEDVIGEPLEEMRVVGRDAQMMKLHLRLGPGQHRRALERHRVVMLVGKVEQGLACRRGHRPEREPRGAAARDSHPPAQAEDRIEHGPDSVGQRPAVPDSGRCTVGMSAAQKAGAIGFELYVARGFAFDDDEMRRPDLRIAVRAPPPRREDRAEAGHELGFDEQFGEGGMSDIVGLPRQGDFPRRT